ncbi:GGDEF domain-containing protein [Vibrio sinensis]|uniref:GGDEF domain-containing protein n=1 Tax=Vibrio sinensis TaxID=2302434 RepID=A0A3A6QYP0_9VIBR|nr:sensor domain-containing diguanylate cyclase [Vibrio sinensis]RJX68327.1 GGDEF domain-containing protein [Vibrio sinensis]
MNKLTLSEFKFFCTRFMLTFTLLVSVSLVIFYYDSISEVETKKSNVKVQQAALLEGKKEYIEWVMGSVVKETVLLSDILAQQQIYRVHEPDNNQTKARLLDKFNHALKIVSQRKMIYDQIRYLDTNGNEIIRINYKQDLATIVPTTELQNKSDRYYFSEIIALTSKQIYISPLDLNIEYDGIEIPFKPVIRLASPIFDSAGKKRGIVVVNYRASYLMDGLELFNLNSGTNYMLLNKDGYFLFNDLYPELEFSFMFKDKPTHTIYSQFPELAGQIQSINSGQIETDQGLMTIESVGALGCINPYCFQQFHVTDNDSTAWKLVSYTAFDKRLDFTDSLALHHSLMRLGVLLSLVLSFFMARYQLRLHLDIQRINYLANNDDLTNLVNRRAFQSQAEETLKAAQESKRHVCLIYIDLDNFKAINDNYGHAAGDKALQHVAMIMNKVFGSEALLARLGGDEFAVLLNSDKQMSNPQQLSESLLKRLRYPISVTPEHDFRISASVGACICSCQQTNLESLMHKADLAMYQAKRAGKNRCVFIE